MPPPLKREALFAPFLNGDIEGFYSNNENPPSLRATSLKREALFAPFLNGDIEGFYSNNENPPSLRATSLKREANYLPPFLKGVRGGFFLQ